MNGHCQELAELADSTEKVRSAISEGRWEEAAALEAKRRAALEQFIAQSRERGAELADRLQRLQAMTQHVMGEVLHHQRRLEREVFTLQQGRKAVRAYNDHSSKP